MTETLKRKTPTKTPINFSIQLNEEQKNTKEIILNSRIGVITGKSGSGKTTLACQIALDLLLSKKTHERIIITRPTVKAIDTNEIGHLPGSANEKLNPYLYPMLESFKKLLYKPKQKSSADEQIKKMVEEGRIEIIPIQFMRGINVDNAILLVDEVQNISTPQLELILTRITKTGKIVFSGDINQCDIKPHHTGMNKLFELTENIDGIEWCELQTNHRDPIVDEILKYF